MVVITDSKEVWIDPKEIRALFSGKTVIDIPKQIDEELGLEIVQKETIEQKYNVAPLDPTNDFHKSLKRQFEEKGYLSNRQVNCLR